MENNCQLWVLNRGGLNSCVRGTPLQNGERLQINKCASLVYDKCCHFLSPELQRRSTIQSKSSSPGKGTQQRRSDHKRTSHWKLTGAVMNTSGFWIEHSPGFHSERNRLRNEHNHSTSEHTRLHDELNLTPEVNTLRLDAGEHTSFSSEHKTPKQRQWDSAVSTPRLSGEHTSPWTQQNPVVNMSGLPSEHRAHTRPHCEHDRNNRSPQSTVHGYFQWTQLNFILNTVGRHCGSCRGTHCEQGCCKMNLVNYACEHLL